MRKTTKILTGIVPAATAQMLAKQAKAAGVTRMELVGTILQVAADAMAEGKLRINFGVAWDTAQAGEAEK